MKVSSSDSLTNYYIQQAQGKTLARRVEFVRGGQRGEGVGSFLGGLFRSIFPFLKSGLKAVGKEALSTGFGVLRDTVSGRSLKESLTDRIQKAGTNLTNKAVNKIGTMTGSGYKRKRKARTGKQSQTRTKKVRSRKTRKVNKKCKRVSLKKKKFFNDIFKA